MEMEFSDRNKERLVNEAKAALEFANSSFFNPEKNPILYHYSTIESLLNGIVVKKPASNEKAISLFSTDHRYMNDDKEIKHGCNIMREVAKKYFDLEFSNDREIFQDNTNIFITSFSKESDSLPMWSTYGNRGDGIAFGFDSSIVKETLKNVYPCLYTEDDMKKYLYCILTKLKEYNTKSPSKEEIVERFYKLGFIHCSMLLQLKSEYYSYEREVRFATSKSDGKDYRYRNNLIIPYTKQYLPKKALKSIVVGPTLEFEKTKRSVLEYIENIGFNDVEIVSSKVPYRNL